MKGKFLVAFLALALLSAMAYATTENIWANSQVVQCFNSKKDFLSKFYGSDFGENLMLVAKPIYDEATNLPSAIYFLAYDSTLDVNQTQTLLEKKTNGEFCAIMFAPLTTLGADFHLINGKLSSTFSSRETAVMGWITSITQKRDATSGLYRPWTCKKELLGTQKKKSMRCVDVSR